MVGYEGDNRISIKGILETLATEKIFLKIDIEGWEYRVIDDLLHAPENVLGFVIEFHDVDLHRDRISRFIERLSSFRPVHLHANNIAGVDPSGDPIIIEATFARSSLIDLTAETCRDYPISDLDFPNDPSKPDVLLRFG
jgi:hypothetical protein